MPNHAPIPHSQQQTKALFKNLRTLADVAFLFGISPKNLKRIIYWNKISSYYRTFEIQSKHGKPRKIDAPSGELRRLQEQLNYIFSTIFQPKRSAHGFCIGKSIVTNASEHANKRYIFNIDLKNFFPSISFGRVMGILMSPRYNLPKTPASILAHICCYNKVLPQGATTSPTISNMICAKLDKELNTLAQENMSKYTRYADDITFSTNKATFPIAIAAVDQETSKFVAVPSPLLTSIISNNYFEINESKIKIYHKNVRQTVTGLVVNKKPNLKHEETRKLRAQIHIFKKFGSVETTKGTISNIHDFAQHFLGKLAFVKMIRGNEDLLYQKFRHDIFNIIDRPSIFLPTFDDKIHAGLFVIDSYDEKNQIPCYGTGFLVQNMGVVTCQHVVNCPDEKIKIYHPKTPHKQHSTHIIKSCKNRDIAVLSPPNEDLPFKFNISPNPTIKVGDDSRIAGFPRYKRGDEAAIIPTVITSTKALYGVQYITVRDIIYDGNSGGPLFNSQNEVIGVIHKGAGATHSGQLAENLAIDIREIFALFK